ncbi:MAG: PhzF family phenazine biosynthesis protein [Solirubrobacteraceae bacterium]|jgi:trans-2,3-dihydro-3-hydroxyanthranilate isomerase
MDLDIDLGSPADTHRYYVVDVFTDTPLTGNQLAVFAAGEAFDSDVMQRLARELAFSETVFVLSAQADGDARIRIFTPTSELPFAGHPVLGSAFVLATATGADAVRLETASGIVAVALERTGGRVTFGRMEQPVPTWQSYEHSGELLAALALERSTLPIEAYTNGPVHVFVVLEREQVLAGLRPDMARLGALGATCFNCVAATGKGWKTRMFAPALGVAEDPATGSGAGPLAVHLARHGLIAFGELIDIHQGAEIGRPSLLRARAVGSGETVERVEVGGSAVIVARGEFRL